MYCPNLLIYFYALSFITKDLGDIRGENSNCILFCDMSNVGFYSLTIYIFELFTYKINFGLGRYKPIHYNYNCFLDVDTIFHCYKITWLPLDG